MINSALLSIILTLLPVPSVAGDTLSVDIIPDFSTVGYRHGDAPYPDYPIVETISPKDVAKALKKKQYPDTTSFIQAAIDRAAEKGGGTVLLKNGVYNVGSVIFLDKDGVVLRGESREGTVLMNTGLLQRPAVVIGRTLPFKDEDPGKFRDFSGRKFKLSRLAVVGPGGRSTFGKYFLDQWTPAIVSPTVGEKIPITEEYCPVGRWWVEVADASVFTPGEAVMIERPHNDAWISDIGMDRIASNGRDKRPVTQWNKRNMKLRWTRRVTAVEGNRVWFDAPLVQSLDRNYGGGFVCKYKMKRVCGSGIENLTLDSSFDPSVRNDQGVCIDERHAWYGMIFTASEDCYAQKVTVRHFGYAAVMLYSGARCISVEDCSFREPVSLPTMARRYGFCITGGDMCLLKECYCELSAIGFATNSPNGGPNVFVGCKGPDMRTGAGPHQSWSTGTLYDCCYNSAGFRCTDHGNSGTGHGWCGANTVFWNVETEGGIECESPWAAENTPGLKFASPHPSARNYSIGTVCGHRVKKKLSKDYYGKPVIDYYESLGYTGRPDAEWYPYVPYEGKGTAHVTLPCADAEASFGWWPRFSIKEFSNPLSLYQCQLEDRRARGIDLKDINRR